MFTILEKRALNDSMTLMRVEAPFIAHKAKAGQFVILRVCEHGERIPLTIADYDRQAGWIAIIFQKVGKTTLMLDLLQEGEAILDLVGPLGKGSELEGVKKAAVIGGGAGCAIAYPQAKALHNMGARVDMIAGFRNRELIILEEEMAAVSDRLFLMTDDGSNGHKGFVTNALQTCIEQGADYDLVVAIGPLPMMKAVCALTKPGGVAGPEGIHTVISMNSLMIDGTGMCGCCRVTVGGKVRFACVDGPDFDGHQVDFDEAMKRSRIYTDQEGRAREEEKEHICNLTGEVRRNG